MYQCSKFNGNLNISAEKIKQLRIKNNLSLSQLSTKLALLGIDIPKNSLHKLEKGKRILKDYELFGLAYILHTSIEDLFDHFIDELRKDNVI